ncbi:endonuclease domain-containing protein [Microlunatus elymi]|uniref:endonuclease domain-containing protein n=1 Tax=Microlunatus elymi TaxID=2596828 RepID=UPI00143DD236|nr:DUF559 domain-containing protein [Microlunatus elymi]
MWTQDIDQLLKAAGGAIRRADHPELRYRLDYLRRRGHLASPLPGILTVPSAEDDLELAVLAGSLWLGPDAVLTGWAAAALTFWPKAPVSRLTFAAPRRPAACRGRYRTERREIPPELAMRIATVAVTSPAMTAVDLAAEDADAIDAALRAGISLDELWAAFRATPGRPGNQQRMRVLRDSRDDPWSAAERRLHRLLRNRGITGWTANRQIRLRSGRRYRADLLFGRQRVIVEFDSYAFHSDRDVFNNDRRRRNELELAGYLVLNFTWAHLIDDPDWLIECIRRALALRS